MQQAARRLLTLAGLRRRPPVVCLYPAFTDPAEFLDAYWKARYFLPPPAARRVLLPVAFDAAFLRPGAEIPRPEYVADLPLPPPHHLQIVPCDGGEVARRADRVLVWDWPRAVDFGRDAEASGRVLNVDRRRSRMEGWVWAGFMNVQLPAAAVAARERAAKARLQAQVRAAGRYRRCYVFGTGPSLETATARDFSDGYRIVCNTIVRHRALLDHIRPHFIVAGDAVYHFGNNLHAAAFRRDLEAAVTSRPALFITRDLFHPLLLHHHPALRAGAIAAASEPSGIHFDMLDRPVYHQLGNILNCLMLPLATALADEVLLLGFDGRAPGEQLFWKNSDANAYNEFRDSIMAAHPAFFSQTDFQAYAGDHSANAERLMAAGEALGKRYVCLNRSYIPAFQKRQAAAS